MAPLGPLWGLFRGGFAVAVGVGCGWGAGGGGVGL